jgi:hypothetical protein
MPRSLTKKISFKSKTQITPSAMWERVKMLSFMSGPCIVGMRGVWGEVQIWANNHQEAERVCRFLLSCGDWSSYDVSRAEIWRATARRSARVPQLMRPAVTPNGVPRLTTRAGPEGPPATAEEDEP